MSVSGNQETAVKSLGGQSSLNIAGVPVKKRWFACSASPTQPEQPQEKELVVQTVEDDSVGKQRHGNASHESELTASSSCLSDANKNFVPEFNTSTGADTSQESDTSAKPVDNEKILEADKSTNLMTVVKPLGGVPMKKRRFIRPSSPPPVTHSSQLVEKDSAKKLHASPSKESSLSDYNIAGSSSVLSDGKKVFAPEDYKKRGNFTGQDNDVYQSNIKIEEACGTIQSEAEVDKLVLAEKSSDVWVKSQATELDLAPNRFPVLNAGKEMLNLQVDGKCLEMSSVSTPELPLGLKERQPSALEGQSNNGSSRNQGSAESVSLKLSLSNSERSAQCIMEDLGSNTENTKICSDRLNWDLNTTMDAWEASVDEEAASQVPADGSKEVGVTHDVKPLTSTGIVGDSFTTEKQLLNDNELITSFSSASSQSVRQYDSDDRLVRQYDSDDRLHLRLSPSFPYFNSQASCSSSANIDSTFAVPNISLPSGSSLGGNMVNSKSVKSELIDESHLPDSLGAKVSPMLSPDFRAVSIKHELADKVPQEASKSPSYIAGKSADGKTIKSEPVSEGNPGKINAMAVTSHQYNKPVLQGQDSKEQSIHSSTEHVMHGQHDKRRVPSSPTDQQVLRDHNMLKKPASSIGSSLNCNSSGHLGHGGASGAHLGNESRELRESAEQVVAEISSPPVCGSCDEDKATGKDDAAILEKRSADNVEQCKLTLLHSDADRDGEGTVSAEEKINLSSDVLDEDSYGSEYESDGNSAPLYLEEDGRGQDDYEDGEVREPQCNAEVDASLCEKGNIVRQADSNDKRESSVGLHADVQPSSSHAEGKDINMEEPVEKIKATVKEIYSVLERKTEDADKDALKEESSAVDVMASEAEEKQVVDTYEGKPLDAATEKDKCLGPEQLSDQATCGSEETSRSAAQGADKNVKRNNGEEDESAPTKTEETSLVGVDAPKDANSGGNQSRIINLSVASNTSYSKTRSISDKPLSFRPIRERLDVPLEGDRLHSRGRDETYNDGSQKFTRERYQNSRNSRWNFVHGRGRLASRIDSARHDRGSERDFIPRHKYASAAVESDNEFMNYSMGSDDAFVGTGRGGRKLVDDDTSIFRHASSRRHSPGERDGSASRGGIHVVRRVPRSIGEDNSEAFGLRHTEKIMRGFPDDGGEHMYARPQQPYEGLDDRFVQGTRNFSSVHRRGLPQMHSKSPIRSHSPGPWSSRRRSPDSFGGPPELPHRRSIYRMERIRSPDNTDFPAERMGRRHGSPSYMSRPNDFREMNTGRDHCHPRSIISNRSPTRLGGFLGSRRFGIVDPRERPDDENFFAGQVHSGRFRELGGDANDERRRFGERRVPVRSFRPPFNNTDGESSNFNTEDGHRPFRFYPEVDPNFHERPNLREREFDRRLKNRPGNSPRRPRSIDDEQGGNYRNAGHVLYDDSFDDISRAKRKRF